MARNVACGGCEGGKNDWPTAQQPSLRRPLHQTSNCPVSTAWPACSCQARLLLRAGEGLFWRYISPRWWLDMQLSGGLMQACTELLQKKLVELGVLRPPNRDLSSSPLQPTRTTDCISLLPLQGELSRHLYPRRRIWIWKIRTPDLRSTESETREASHRRIS